jgi:hypothetical protein
MIGWVLQVTVISLCFIAVVHYLYIFFKTTLTVPKVKDLVNRPQQQYEELFKGITHTSPHLGGSYISTNNNNNNNNNNTNNNTTSISELPPLFEPQDQNRDQTAMKDELKQFLKKLNNK